MKIKFLAPLLAALTLSACNEKEPDIFWLKESSGVFVHIEGTKDRFYQETEYSIDESCNPNEVMVNNRCEIAITLDAMVKEGFSVAVIPTEKPDQFTLRVFHDKHRPLNIQVSDDVVSTKHGHN